MGGKLKGIPEQLQGFEFVFLRKQEKIPIPSKEGNVVHRNFAEALEHPWNTGVLMSNDLYVVDIDNKEIADKIGIDGMLTDTFTVKTGKGFHHYYTDPNRKPRNTPYSLEGEHFMDIRANPNSYVVTPPSIHPSGAVYQVFLDRPIAEQPLEELLKSLDTAVGKTKEANLDVPKVSKRKWLVKPRLAITIHDVWGEPKGRKSKGGIVIEHPVHGATNGGNVDVRDDGEVFYCFRCGCGGDVCTALALSTGVIKQCNESFDWNEVQQKAIEQGLLRSEDMLDEPIDIPLVIGPMKDYTTLKPVFDGKGHFTGGFDAEIDFGRFISHRTAICKGVVLAKDGIIASPLRKLELDLKIKTALSQTELVFSNGEKKPIKYRWGPKDQGKHIFDNLEKLAEVKDESTHEGKIILQNGVLDIKNQDLTQHKENFATFSYLSVEYDPEAPCPETLKAMRQIFEPDQLEAWMSLMGARLAGTPTQFIAVLHGEGGQGKGVVRDHTQAFFGAMFTQAPMEDVNARFKNQIFLGKKIVWNSEVPATKQVANIMNSISGGGAIQVESKGVDGVLEVYLQALICMDVNLLAPLPESYSTERRLQYYPLRSRFADVEDPPKRLFKKDIKILDKIKTAKELSGWLNALLPYAQYYLEMGYLLKAMPPNIELFNLKADSVDTFLSKYTEFEFGGRTRTGLLRRAYIHFCKEEKNGAKPWFSVRLFLKSTLGVRFSGNYIVDLRFDEEKFQEDYQLDKFGCWR